MNNSLASRLTWMTVFLGLCMIAADSASGATLYAANNGVDSATCGRQSAPCRSISQTITNAAAGDSIEVGPGHYGDLSGNGTFSGPGDEQPTTLRGFNGDLGCIICITKPVRIYSVLGAALTVIDAKSAAFTTTVLINSDGVAFGDLNKGFTITGGNVNGLLVFNDFLFTSNINKIVGNVDLNDANGFVFAGRDYDVRFCQFGGCAVVPAYFLNNQAIGNSTGFSVAVNFDRGEVILENNSALNAGVGFNVSGGIQCNEGCTNGPASIARLTLNVAAHGGIGYSLSLPGTVFENKAIDNSQVGFYVTAGVGLKFQNNTAIGNAGPGAAMVFVLDPGDGSEPNSSVAAFNENNFIGNDRNRPVLTIGANNFGGPFPNLGPSAHCGVLFLGAIASFPPLSPPFPTENLLAANNYWGSPKGPSSQGPGDTSGGACDQTGGITKSTPFSAAPFAIAPAAP
jgi:hypothetical protein